MTNPDVIVRKMERDAQRARSERDASFEKVKPHLQATITSRDGSVRTRWDPNVLWIHLNNVETDLSAAYNDGVIAGDDAALAGLGVLVAPAPKAPYPYQIVRKDPTQFVMGGQSSQTGNYDMPQHGGNHQIPAEDNKGSDPVYVYQPALRMLKCEGDGSTLVVTVHGYRYNHNGTTRSFTGQQVDLSSHVPGSGLERRVLLYLDKALNFIQVVEGDTVSASGATPAPYPAIPGNARASAYVTLEDGQTAVTTATHVEDARDFLAIGQDLALGGLIDVNLSGLTDGQVISYDLSSNTWVAETLQPIFDADDIMTDANGDIMVDANGNVMLAS